MAASSIKKVQHCALVSPKLKTVENFRKITVVLKEQSNFTLLQNIFWLWFNWQSK